MNMEKRNPLIDYARYVFAFLVVFIHVPLAHGGGVLMPIARCAVPFFYLVTGYFLGKASGEDAPTLTSKLKGSSRKWLRLWLKYTSVLLFISIVLDTCMGQWNGWTLNDTITMIMSGVCPFIDQHEWGGKTYGITTLWFLYCGFLAFCLLYAMRKFVYTRWFLSLVVLAQVLFAIACYKEWTNWLFFYSTLPFICYGLWLGRWHRIGKMRLRTDVVIFLCAVFFVIGVVEYYLVGKDVRFMNIPLSLSLFILILKSEKVCSWLYSKQILPPPDFTSVNFRCLYLASAGLLLDESRRNRNVWVGCCYSVHCHTCWKHCYQEIIHT